MKYSIRSLLNGIEAHNKVQLGIRTRSIKRLEKDYQEARSEYLENLASVRSALAYADHAMDTPTPSSEEVYEALRKLEDKIARANRYYGVRRAKRTLEEAQQELENLHAGTKTEFELWLLSLQDDGVAEVSSNAIKTAGFDEKDVTKYVTAARKLEEASSDPATTPA